MITQPLYKKLHAEGGIGLVEIAIALPLFLVLVFTILGLSLYFNAKTTFSTAVSQAVKKADTRGDYFKYQETFHLPLDCFYYFREGSNYLEPFDESVCNPVEGSSYWEAVGELLYFHNISAEQTRGGAALSYYDTMSKYCDHQSRLEDLPRTYLYTLAYLYSYMRKSVGNSVRYPCDPSTEGGEGCVQCTFSLPDGYVEPSGLSCRRHEHISISCSYKPKLIMLNSVLSFIGIDSQNFGIFTVEVHT